MEEHMEKKHVLVGMSGGVDSSVTAYLLLQQGYHVTGVHMITLPESQGQSAEIEDAQKVCDTLGIELIVIDKRAEFQKEVIEYFVDEYQRGRTPNPCVVCNRKIKWPMLLHNQEQIKVDYIATGHYAKIIQMENGRFAIKHAKTATKDQTYMLFNLTQEQLAHTLFPLGDYEKEDVREIAKNINARIAAKNDSQEICFVKTSDYVTFIEEFTHKEFVPGNYVDTDGNVIGKHKGIARYTIGQRKGLDINLNKKAFVVDIDATTNEITLGDNDDLYASSCQFDQINFMGIESIEGELKAKAKARYSQKPSDCIITKIDKDNYLCTFTQAQRAMTPGQALVFYDDQGVILGGGLINKIIH